jgi:hypothetical protein
MKGLWIGLFFLIVASPSWALESAGQQEVPLTPKMKVAVKSAVTRSMRDPGSAQFGPSMTAFRAADGTLDVCGEVNGRNALGGYTGNTAFHVALIDLGTDDPKIRHALWFGVAAAIDDNVNTMFPVCDSSNWK